MQLSAAQLAFMATILDFKTQFESAARRIIADGEITTHIAGEGVPKLTRTSNSVHFQKGACDPARRIPIKIPTSAEDQVFAWIHCAYEGILTFEANAPFEKNARDGTFSITEDHARALDETVSIVDVLFLEVLSPFAKTDYLSLLDVQSIVPIEPDERPEHEREINVATRRWRIRFEIRTTAFADMPV